MQRLEIEVAAESFHDLPAMDYTGMEVLQMGQDRLLNLAKGEFVVGNFVDLVGTILATCNTGRNWEFLGLFSTLSSHLQPDERARATRVRFVANHDTGFYYWPLISFGLLNVHDRISSDYLGLADVCAVDYYTVPRFFDHLQAIVVGAEKVWDRFQMRLSVQTPTASYSLGHPEDVRGVAYDTKFGVLGMVGGFALTRALQAMLQHPVLDVGDRIRDYWLAVLPKGVDPLEGGRRSWIRDGYCVTQGVMRQSLINIDDENLNESVFKENMALTWLDDNTISWYDSSGANRVDRLTACYECRVVTLDENGRYYLDTRAGPIKGDNVNMSYIMLSPDVQSEYGLKTGTVRRFTYTTDIRGAWRRYYSRKAVTIGREMLAGELGLRLMSVFREGHGQEDIGRSNSPTPVAPVDQSSEPQSTDS